MTPDDHESGSRCLSCSAPAVVVCPECVRAIALQWFGAVARHPETGTGCVLCEQGHSTWCGSCFIEQVANHRTTLRKAGVALGEPAGWSA